MIESEAAKLLAVLAAYDRRTVGDVDVQVWAEQMRSFRLEDAVTAVHKHYATSSEWLDPNRLRRLVADLRNERIAHAGHPIPPYELAEDPVAARQWVQDFYRRVGDGEDPLAVESASWRPVPALDAAFHGVDE
jgi:hypothetical protein